MTEITCSDAASSHEEPVTSADNGSRPPEARTGGGQSAADALLEQASESLIRKAIDMALSGHSSSLRLCLDRLTQIREGRRATFALPEIAGSDDLPKATLALLRAMTTGEITSAEATAYVKLIGAHIKAIEVNLLAKKAEKGDISNPQGPILIKNDMTDEEAGCAYRRIMGTR